MMRLPLQVGTAALASLLRAAALLMPAGLLSVVALYVVIFLVPDLGDDVMGAIFAVVAGPPLTLLFFAWKHLKRARAERPSDVLLDGAGFRLEGGPHHGLTVAWPEVTRCELVGPVPVLEDDVDEAYRLQLERQRAPRVCLASTNHEAERASLADVARTLSAGPLAPRAEAAPAEVLGCPACHAPVPPSARAEVRCAFCGATVPMPGALRAKVEAQDQVVQHDARSVLRLLDQPGARFVGALFGVGAGVMLSAWPLAAVVMLVNWNRGKLTWTGALFLVTFVAACLAGFFAFLRGRLVDRQALRLLTVRFCAKPREKGFGCRACGAPLPEGPARTLVGCAYCGAPNILAVDFTQQAQAVAEEAGSLTQALARRQLERRTWRFATAGGLALIAASGWALNVGLARDPVLSTNTKACDRGVAQACLEVGRAWHHRDRERAQLAFKAACDADLAQGCSELAELWSEPGTADSLDPRLPVPEFWRKACDLGLGAACEALGELYKKGDALRQLPKNDDESTRAYEKGCALGWAEACTDWGYALFHGRGADVDRPRAAQAYEKACGLHHPMGCNNLGTMYENGEGGLAQDLERARALYAEACDAGITLGCNNARGLRGPR